MGADPGTAEAAKLVLGASDLHAVAYKAWLEQQPGQKPRLELSSVETKELARFRNQHPNLNGLQANLSNATIAKKFAALRRIYRMLIACNLGITSNPFDSDRVPAPPKNSGQKRPTEMINFNKVQEVLKIPDATIPKGLRDQALLAVMFGGALRRSEVTGLRIGDLRQTEKGTAFIRLRATKAKKDVDQALPPWAAEPVRKLVMQRLTEGAKSGDYLFVSYRGPGGKFPTNKPFSTSGLYRLFLSYCRQAGIKDFVSPHSARATAITKLLSDGFSHREVQEFSRHSSIQMVEVYDKRRLSIDENPGRILKF